MNDESALLSSIRFAPRPRQNKAAPVDAGAAHYSLYEYIHPARRYLVSRAA
jgi:hypothetical protein